MYDAEYDSNGSETQAVRFKIGDGTTLYEPMSRGTGEQTMARQLSTSGLPIPRFR